MSEGATILVVDDEPRLVDLYAEFLSESYEVRTATGGEAALERLDGAVDLVILDRRMPGLSGDELLGIVRSHGFDVPVLMITGVDADFDVLSMSFNDYLTKPTTAVELRDRVDTLLRLSRRDVQLQEYFALLAKRRALEEGKHDAELAESNDYTALEARIERLEERIDPPLSELEDDLAARLRSGTPEPVSF